MRKIISKEEKTLTIILRYLNISIFFYFVFPHHYIFLISRGISYLTDSDYSVLIAFNWHVINQIVGETEAIYSD